MGVETQATRRTSDRARQPERGVIAVEFALVLPLLAMLLLGLITTGMTFAGALGVTNAVREGSRFAATTPHTTATSTTWRNDVLTRTAALQYDSSATTTRICVDLVRRDAGTNVVVATGCNGVALPTGAPTPGPVQVPAGTTNLTCVVRVWAAQPFSINAVLFSVDDQVLVRESVAVFERPPC